MAFRTFSPNSYEMSSLIKMFRPRCREVERLNLNTKTMGATMGMGYAAILPANGNLSQAVYVGL
jgi:hypothetical protein